MERASYHGNSKLHEKFTDESMYAIKQQRESEETHLFIMSVHIEGRNFPVDIRFGVEENYKRIMSNIDEMTLDDIGEYRLYWGIHDCFGEIASKSEYPRYFGDPNGEDLPF